MPSAANYVRDYNQEQKTARARGETKDRAKRNAARAKQVKAGRASKGDGKDVDHKKGIKGGNGSKNLRTISPKANRSAGGKKGNKAGKAMGARKGRQSTRGTKK